MAYKYQPIKDEIFASDDEGDVEEVEDGEEQQVEDSILSTLVENEPSKEGSSSNLADTPTKVERVTREILSNTPKVLPPNSKVKQVIEQDGVLILETVETDPNDPEALPMGSTVIASGNDTNEALGEMSMDDSAILAELEDF